MQGASAGCSSKGGMTNKKSRGGNDNDSIGDGDTEDKGGERGVVGGGVKGDNRKQTNGCTKQTTKTRNVLQTQEVVKELRAS